MNDDNLRLLPASPDLPPSLEELLLLLIQEVVTVSKNLQTLVGLLKDKA